MANNIANQTKNAQVNSFTGGINTDLHPMLQPNNTLTDCVNGTLITYNGNENMLQNDMGNYALEGAKLPPNYVPIGVKEHAGILYVVAYNPTNKNVQIGSYPSPKVNFDKFEGKEATITVEPYRIKNFMDSSCDSFDPFDILDEQYDSGQKEGHHLYSNVVKGADNLLKLLGTMDHDGYKLTINDQYKLILTPGSDSDTWLQELMFFSVSKDGKVENISEKITTHSDSSDYNNVDWQSEGWLGVKYELVNVSKSTQTITNVVYPTYGRTVNTVWTVDERGEYKIATANLSQKYSYYEDPFIMIPNNENNNLIWQKHYWQFEIPEEDNVLIYYSKNAWNPKDGVKYSVSTSPEQSYYHKIVFEDSIQNLGDIMATYNYSSLDGENYLYLFLPKYASINETSEKLFNSDLKLFVFIHSDSKEEFVFKSNLEFINKPINTVIHAENACIKELYCSEYNDLTVDYNKIGVFIDGSTNGELSVPSFPNIISDSKINILADSDDSLDEEYLTITYETSTGLKVDLGWEFEEKVIEHTYEWEGVGKITFLGKTISENAFKGCEYLESITLPYGTTDIGEQAFSGCIRLKKLVIPHSVESLGYGAFYGCTQLASLTISDKVTRVSGKLCAGCTSLSSVIIGTGVNGIGADAFSGCSALVDINIPGSVFTIGDNAFKNCGLEKIILPDSIETIGMNAFRECSQLKYCKLPRNMKVLDTYTFLDSGLKTLVCGHKLEKIGMGSVPADTRIYILNSEQPVDFSTFESGGGVLTKSLHMYVPESIEDEYINNSFGSVTGFDEKSNLIYFADEKLSIGGTHEFYEGVGYFYVGILLEGFGAQKIHTVIIPNNVTSIYENAFKNSSIQSIFIPTNIKSIESKAFYNCTSLKYIEFESGAINFKEDAFGANKIDIVRVPSVKDWCANLFANRYASPVSRPVFNHETRLYIGYESNRIEVPEETTSLTPYIFAGLSNVTISIPYDLTSIDKYAFAATILSNIVIEYRGSEIKKEVDVKTFENTTVYVKPELYYKYMFDLKLSGTWKALYTNVYVTGKDSDLWIGDFGEIKVPESSGNIHYFVPDSWQNRRGYNSDYLKLLSPKRISAAVKDVDYEENIFHKYVYNVLMSDKNIIGWKFSEENNLEIYALSGVDTSVEVKIETVSSGNWKWSTHVPYKINNTTSDKKESVTWYLEGTPVAVSTGDLLKFTVNNEFRLPKTIWKKVLGNKTCSIKLAIRLTGYSEDGSTFNTKFADGKSYYCIDDVRTKEFAGFIDAFTNFDFSESIPAHIKKINIESVLFCIEHQDTTGKLLVLDQTLQSDTILLPEYENIDNSSAEVIGFTYSVAGTGEDEKVDDRGMRKVECIFTFNEFIESEDVWAVLRDLNGDSVIYSITSSGGVNNEHVIEFSNVPKEFQFAQLELIVESNSKFKEDILINTKVTTSKSNWFNRINMSTIPWNKVIDEIIADIDNNEWDLNISVEVDESCAISKPCVYGLNENNEIVDLTEWTEDTIPADVVPIVDEDGFIPGYENMQLADMVYAPVKIDITLGSGIKICGDINSFDLNYSDGVDNYAYAYDKNLYVGSSSIGFLPINIYRIKTAYDRSSRILGVPVYERFAKYLYRPLGINDWLNEDSSEILQDYWEESILLSAEVQSKELISGSGTLYPVFNWYTSKTYENKGTSTGYSSLFEILPAIFPIKFSNNTDWFGIHRPIYLDSNTSGFDAKTKTGGVKRDCWNTQGRKVCNSSTNGGKCYTSNIQDVVFGFCDKSKIDFYTIGLNCVDKFYYPWLKNTPLWTKEEFLKFEKELFLLSLMCRKIKYLTFESNRALSIASISTSITHPKIDCVLKNAVCEFGKCSDINFSFETSFNVKSKSLFNILTEKIEKYKNISDNPLYSNNPFVKNFTDVVTKECVQPQNIDFSFNQAEVLHFGYFSSTYPKYFLPITSFGYISAERGKSTVGYKSLGYEYNDNYELSELNLISDEGECIHPWSLNSEFDFFNQLHQKFAPDGKLTLTIDGAEKTQTVDEWLEYYLKLLIEEQKYEQDYNKLKN